MKDDAGSQQPLVAVVGPCTSGKSTLVNALREAGYSARQPAQEHSYVKEMWQIRVKPDVLIYLDVGIEAARQRRAISWGAERLAEQAERLAHAREHCDLYILTDEETPESIQSQVLLFLGEWGGK